jgi:hypothetical protein
MLSIPHEPHDIHDLLRLHPESRSGFGLPEPFVLDRVIDARRRSQQLKHVFIAGHDNHIDRQRFRFAGQGADQVIGF